MSLDTQASNASLIFFKCLCLLCTDCRSEHDRQGHGGSDSEERHRQRHGGVHVPGGELHWRLTPLGVADRSGRCVGRTPNFCFFRLTPLRTSHSFVACLFPPDRLQSCHPRRCPRRRTWRSSSTAWASSSLSSLLPQPSSAGSAAHPRRATSTTSLLSRSSPRASR